jgi:hypothetical protein
LERVFGRKPVDLGEERAKKSFTEGQDMVILAL